MTGTLSGMQNLKYLPCGLLQNKMTARCFVFELRKDDLVGQLRMDWGWGVTERTQLGTAIMGRTRRTSFRGGPPSPVRSLSLESWDSGPTGCAGDSGHLCSTWNWNRVTAIARGDGLEA